MNASDVGPAVPEPVSSRLANLDGQGMRSTRQGPSDLLCYVDGIPSDDEQRVLAAEFPNLLAGRRWTVTPIFEDDSAEDLEDWTLGVSMVLPSSDDVTADVDRQVLADVEALVAWAQKLSKVHGIEFAFELDGDSAGWIEDGEIDRLLAEGLLEPWRSGTQ